MTRIGILSDTHSCWDDRFALYFAECDEIWHAGDIGCEETLRQLQGIGPKVRAVRGNIDHGPMLRECPELQIFRIEDCTVLMTHVGGYPWRYAPGIENLLIQHRPTLMIAGHSHILKVMYDQRFNLLHINPGAAGYHGWHKERTLVRLKIDGINIHDVEIIELAKIISD